MEVILLGKDSNLQPPGFAVRQTTNCTIEAQMEKKKMLCCDNTGMICVYISFLLYFNPCPAESIKMPHPFLIFSQSEHMILIFAINSQT